MPLRTLIMLYYFMQVLYSARKYYTKIEYFPKHILFTTIYLLQEQKLNPRNYYEQEIYIINILQDTENDVNMYAKFGGFNYYVSL
jgi:hypothetical protein